MNNIHPASNGPQAAHPVPMQHAPGEGVNDSIALIEDDDLATTVTPEAAPIKPQPPASKIHGITGAGLGAYKDHAWKRTPHVGHNGAMRMRSFHGRLSEQGLDFLDNAINDFLDVHPEIEIKFVTSTTGMFDGKIKEPALILNLWY